MNKISRGFASDNNAGVHPEIVKEMNNVNEGHVVGYGDDVYTSSAIAKFKEHFGNNIDVYFVFTGTAANVLGLSAATNSFNSIICAETSHLNVDECGAPEKFSGCKLLTIPTKNGKITIEQIKHHMHGFDDQHHVQPKIISIAQSTELGTIYTVKEIKELADFAHKNGLLFHMDGARLSNAAATLKLSLKEITADVGVDILSFGGTKNGMMFGEAVIFFNKSLSKNFKYVRKQGMQLASKMRFVSAQFESLLSNNLWLKNAEHSNKMAKMLAKEVENISKVKITQKTESNAVFAIIPKEAINILKKEYFFYTWNEETSEVRWMCSFDTAEEDIHNFVSLLKKILK